jgi:hypothetical protein
LKNKYQNYTLLLMEDIGIGEVHRNPQFESVVPLVSADTDITRQNANDVIDKARTNLETKFGKEATLQLQQLFMGTLVARGDGVRASIGEAYTRERNGGKFVSDAESQRVIQRMTTEAEQAGIDATTLADIQRLMAGTLLVGEESMHTLVQEPVKIPQDEGVGMATEAMQGLESSILGHDKAIALQRLFGAVTAVVTERTTP